MKKKIIALVLVALGVFSLSACKKEAAEGTIVVGYSNFSEKFSPFFADSAYDVDVAGMTQGSLLAADRTGAILLNAGNSWGEKVKYNGTNYTYYSLANCKVSKDNKTYTFTLRRDVKFSDGEKVTADDVIFSMYVLCDPSYDGSSTLFNVPIKGIEEYRSGYTSKQAEIVKNWDAYVENTAYTAEEYNKFKTAFVDAVTVFAQDIVDFCMTNYASYGAVDVKSSAGLWGFTLETGATAKDFGMAIAEAYSFVPGSMNAEKGGDKLFTELLVEKLGSEDEYNKFYNMFKVSTSADKIEGITKVNDYTVKVELTEVSAVALYQFALSVAPLHYYGSDEAYDYENNKFGFTKGDLTPVKSKTTQPLGCGPYIFDKYENGVVYFTANENYYLGCPETKNVQFKEGSDSDKLTGVTSGTVDVSDPSFSTTAINAIKKANSNGELTGDKVTTSLVDNLGYGYIGICADVVKVGTDKSSEASKNLRKGIATVLSVYRELSVSSYYGDRATVINYPISNTSWAAPQATDKGYEVAYSKKVNGSDIYSSGMTAAEKYAAAEAAALEYFVAAGYTASNGKITAAPAGASMSYEAWIPADGSGDHPVFMLLEEAAKSFANIGLEFKIKDLANSADLWDALDAKTVAVWAAAWGSTVDPDMSQVYKTGTSSNHYGIADDDLDALIEDALKITDKASRKEIYKDCLDTVLDWAVEIPTYQRKNAVIFATERIDMNSVAKDITPFYGWLSEIDKVKLVK